MTLPLAEGSPRVLVVGDDGEVGAVLHLHLLRAGWAPVCVPSPELVEPIAPIVAPHAIVLVLPETPETSWGTALTASATAAQAGVRVVLVAPSPEVVEPLALVSGAERALSRSEALASPRSVLGSPPPRGLPPPFPAGRTGITGATRIARQEPPRSKETSGFATRPAAPPAHEPRPPAADDGPSSIDLAELLRDERLDTTTSAATPTHLVADVSLVSEHNFFVGRTRRLDSGGVFVATPHPPPVGTTLEVRLGLPDARKLEVRGEVVFVRERAAMAGRQPAGCGVRLISMPSWAVSVVERFFVARPPIVHQP